MYIKLLYHIAIGHAVNVGANNGEVFEALRWRGVRNVDQYSEVVSDCTHPALEGARESALRQLELEWKMVIPSGHDGYRTLFIFICNYIQ